MASVTMTTRPPLSPFTRESAIQKVRLAEDGWNSRDPGKVALAYAIDYGGTALSSSTDGTKSFLSCLASGRRSWTTGSSRNCGRSLGIGSPYASLTSGTTTRVTGIALMAMRTGSSMRMGSWPYGLRRSTTFTFWNQIANTTGRSGAVQMTTQG